MVCPHYYIPRVSPMKPGDLVRNRLVYDRYEMGIIVKSGYCEYTGEEEVLVKWVHSKKLATC